MALGEEPRCPQRDFGRPCSAITVHHSQFDAIEKKGLFHPPPLLSPALHHRQDAASSVFFSVFALLRPASSLQEYAAVSMRAPSYPGGECFVEEYFLFGLIFSAVVACIVAPSKARGRQCFSVVPF